MRKKAKPKLGLVDPWVFLPVFALVVIGVWLVFDASYAKAADYSWTNKDPWYFAKKQIVSALIGICVMYVVSKVRIDTLAKLAKALVVASVMLLVLVMVPGIGYKANGAWRWFKFFGFTLQPSEIAKLALVIYLADFLSQKKSVVHRIDSRWALPAVAVGAIALLVLKEPDMGTTIAIIATCMAMLFAAGAKKSHLALMMGAGVFLAWVAVKLEPYRLGRMDVWREPWSHRYGDGYQIVHSLIALGTGGVVGVGLCEGREKLYIPAASTDFIFATVGEEAGLIGCLVVLALFLFFIYKGLDVARRAKGSYANLLAVGVTSMIGLQALINVAVVSSSIPATGVPLPFISYGGSSLILTLAGVGILLAVSRHGSESDN
jgi:cell division protein FtsW